MGRCRCRGGRREGRDVTVRAVGRVVVGVGADGWTGREGEGSRKGDLVRS